MECQTSKIYSERPLVSAYACSLQLQNGGSKPGTVQLPLLYTGSVSVLLIDV